MVEGTWKLSDAFVELLLQLLVFYYLPPIETP